MAAVAGGAALATRWLTGSPRFALAEVEVRGASPAPREEIVEALAPAMGENVFRVSLEAIERRLRREPWIADVSVRRSLPDGLIIEVEERRAAAVAELGGLYLVGREGRACKRADPAAAVYAEESGRAPLGEVHTDPHRGLTLYTRAPVVGLKVGRVDGAETLRRRLAAFDAAWAALTPREREDATTFHLDRDGRPLRV